MTVHCPVIVILHCPLRNWCLFVFLFFIVNIKKSFIFPSNGEFLSIIFFLVPVGINAERIHSLAEKHTLLLLEVHLYLYAVN